MLDGADERWDALSEALLLYAARRDHVAKLIGPALARGAWVVSDRFADSTLAYQGYGRGLPLADLRALHRLALGDFAPDLTLILDLPTAEGLARAARRAVGLQPTGWSRGNPDRFERLGSEFHERLRQGFRQIAADDPGRCAVIDAGGLVGNVHRAVLACVAERLGIELTP